MGKRFLFIFMFVITFFNAVHGENVLEKRLLLQLHCTHDSSITKVEKEKYYVNIERVSVSEGGLYLHSDYFGPIAMKHILQDKEGVYVTGIFDYYKCDFCGRVYGSLPSRCETCGGISFSVIDLFPE